jgi:aerotaxis receptor
MRLNTPVTEQERVFSAGLHLISATDLQGTITYCNEDFADVSGFVIEQLLGSPHNVVRHPDMPEAVFAHMWSYLKAGKAWMGVVKNRCQNGDFYWVSAYVTPILEQGRTIGYESVRVKPTAEQIERAGQLYAQIRSKGLPRSLDIPRFRLLSWGIPLGAGILALSAYHGISPAAGAGLCLLTLPLLHGWHTWRYERLMQRLFDSLDGAFDSELIARLYSRLSGRPARLQMALISERSRIQTLLCRLSDYADQSSELSQRSGRLTGQSKVSLQQQSDKTVQAATDIGQIVDSITEVSGNIQRTTDEAQRVGQLARDGSAEAQRTRALIEALAATVTTISNSVEDLAQNTHSIHRAAEMIHGIAEQTNLLALNAAIEAARAGDQGRGFAVVADEVRALATRTRESTDTIQEILQVLQVGAGKAASVAQSGRLEAEAGVQQVITTQQALQGIVQAIERVSEMGGVMASTTERQALFAEDVALMIKLIAEASDHNAGLAVESAQAGQELEQTSRAMHALVERFSSTAVMPDTP